MLLLHGMMNQFGIRLVALLNNVSVWWHILGVLIIVAVLAFVPSKHASATYVFTNIVNNTGWHSTFYVLLLGLLLAQYTFTGYDASAHMTEETRERVAQRAARHRDVDPGLADRRLGAADRDHVRDPEAALLRSTPARWCRRPRSSSPRSAAPAPSCCCWSSSAPSCSAGCRSVTANSRMIYAFSRDGALPGSNLWHQVNKRTRTPTNAIWLAAGGALILGLPYLWNSAAYAAVTSIATIGLYIAYVAPTFLRLRQGESFKRGPWHLGRWSYVVGWIAVTWVVFITILFMLPTASPIGWGNFNYTVDRRGRGDRLRRHLLAGLGEELVHRAEGSGHA